MYGTCCAAQMEVIATVNGDLERGIIGGGGDDGTERNASCWNVVWVAGSSGGNVEPGFRVDIEHKNLIHGTVATQVAGELGMVIGLHMFLLECVKY